MIKIRRLTLSNFISLGLYILLFFSCSHIHFMLINNVKNDKPFLTLNTNAVNSWFRPRGEFPTGSSRHCTLFS